MTFFRKMTSVILTVGLLPVAVLQAQTITTVVGNGTKGYSGDGGAATSASLNTPRGMTVDASGNLYIADNGNNRIRKVATNGIITTVAGNGTQGYSGDDGVATSASLNNPAGVVVDASGNLYIADTYNHRIRKVATNGIITTVAGNGTAGYSGDGGVATSASLNIPAGVVVDASGNLYIADAYNHRIRKMATNGIITTVAGNGMNGYSGDGGVATSTSLNNPRGVTVDAKGNLYIADYLNYRIRKVATNGIITTVAGNGTIGYSGDGGVATSASLATPTGVVVDASGNLYIADNGNNRIRKVATNGIITTVAGNGTQGYSGDGGVATSASFGSLWGVTVDAKSNLYIADTGNNRIRRVTPQYWKVAGVGDFDGDGQSDLMWRNSSTGENRLWFSANSATALTLVAMPSQSLQVAGVGDFNADGQSDLLWRNSQSGLNVIWLSAVNAQAVTTEANLDWKIVGVGDFNGDKVSDIMWRNISTGENRYWPSADSAKSKTLTSSY